MIWGLFVAGCIAVFGHSYVTRHRTAVGGMAAEHSAPPLQPGPRRGRELGDFGSAEERIERRPAPASADPVFTLASDVSSRDAENARSSDPRARHRASQAGDLGSSGRAEHRRLVYFNAGVELGQLLIIVVCLPVGIWLFRRTYGFRVATVLSSVVASFGAYWFVERLIGQNP